VSTFYILDERVDFDQDRNEMTHLSSALRFFVKT